MRVIRAYANETTEEQRNTFLADVSTILTGYEIETELETESMKESA